MYAIFLVVSKVVMSSSLSRYQLRQFWPVLFWEFELWFPYPIVFRLSRYGSATTSPPLIFAKDYYERLHHFGITFTLISSWYRDIIILSCICIDNPIALLLRHLPIETSLWVLPATWLVHISDHTSHSIHTISSWCISWYHLLCHKVFIAYTIAILVREALHEKRAQTTKSQTSF